MRDNCKGTLPSIELNSIKFSTNGTSPQSYLCTFNNKSCRCVKFDQLVARHDEKFGRNPFHVRSTNNRQRKLLSYLDKTVHKNTVKSGRSYTTSILNKGEKSGSLLRPEITPEKETEAWDDWSDWSTCSATCGSGRRVRWRHCSANNCAKGLKRAQIKSCHLKKCESNFLNWFGIKTR